MSRPRRGSVRPPPSDAPPRSNSLPNSRTPPPAPPLIGPTGSPTLDCIADAINSTAAPFQNAPPPEQGAAGWVAQGLGGVLGVVGAPQQLIDNAFAGLTAPIAALFPSMPAVTLLGMHVGMLHTHAHPPSLIPPAPPIPLPSIGMLVGSGAMAVLGCGLPLARAGDIGISVTCGTFAPPFEVFTGSSNVFVGGARAARVLDITKHCDPTVMGPFGIAMAAAGVAAGVAGAVATNQAAQAVQAAADAAVLALKLLAGKDPGIPPGIGALLGPPLPTVLIGGFPCPPIGDMAVGALMKGLKKVAKAAKKMRSSRRANANCADGSHPIYLVTGENFDHFTDFVSPGLFRWQRHYTTARAAEDGPLGFGFRHSYQRHLDVRLHKITFYDWDGVALEFPGLTPERPEVHEHGYVLRRIHADGYELSTRDQRTLVFEGDRFTEVLPLTALRDEHRELRLDYDARGWLVSLDDRRLDGRDRQRYQLRHDAAGRIVAIHELADRPLARFACSYSDAGELHQVRAANDGLWVYDYDDAHRWTRQTDPRGYAYSFRYDAEGRCVWASGQDGLWQAEVEYRPDERLTRLTEGDGAVWTYRYDAGGFITEIINPQGAAIVREHDPDGLLLREVDPGGRELSYLYDAVGALIGRLDRFGYLHPPELEAPELGDPFARELPDTALARCFAGTVEPQRDAALGSTGRTLTIPKQLRALAYQVFRLRERGAPVHAADDRDWHDALGQRIYALDSRQRAQRWQYDASGNLVAMLDRDDRLHRWEIDSWNLIGARIDPLGHTTRYGYDRLEQMTELCDPLGNRTRWGYDAGQRLTKVWRHDRLRDVYEYDDGDHFTAKYDGDGELIFRNAEFDERSHFVTRRELASGGEHRFAYDTRGRIVEASTEAHDVRLGFGFQGQRSADLRDGRGIERRSGAQLDEVRVLERFVWSCERDDAGGLTLRSPTGAHTRITHDLDGVVVRACSNGTQDWMQYDEAGRLEGRLSARPHTRGHTGWGVRYGYSAAGDLLSVADSARGTTHYQVDAAHRLIGETTPRGEQLHYAYDAANNLIERPGLSRLAIASGNRADASATEIFDHDSRDRICARHHRDGPEARYTYDSFDMLERIEWRDAAGEDHDWRAAYDAIGRRLWAECDGQRREFFWDGDRLAAEIAPDGRLRIYLYASHDALVPLSFVDYDSVDADPQSGREYQVFCDGSGMPLHIEDAQREIVWWASRIDPYGRVEVHESATIDYALRWPGHYFDAETGLHCNRYRYYDPDLGRYLSPDPTGYRGSEVNLYGYCTNPLVQVDVLGLTHRRNNTEGSKKSTSGDVDGIDGPPRLKKAVLSQVTIEHEQMSNSERKKAIMVAGVRDKSRADADIYLATNADAKTLSFEDLHPMLQRRVKAQKMIIDLNRKLIEEYGFTTRQIQNMSDEQIQTYLDGAGVPHEVDGMSAVEQLRRTNGRVKYREDQLATLNKSLSGKDWTGLHNENGLHGEVKALNDALKDFEAYHQRPATADDLDNFELYTHRIPQAKSHEISELSMSRCSCCRWNVGGVTLHQDLKSAENEIDENQSKQWGEP